MRVTNSPAFKYLVCPLVFALSVAWGFETRRASGGLLLAALACAYVYFLWRGRPRWMRLLWVAFVVATLIPVDVSLRNFPGPPRFVPYFSGMPTEEAAGEIRRGEVMWSGSCFVNGHEPEYVLVW